MPMRLSVGKRAGEASEGSIGRRRRLSSVGHNFATRSAHLDPNDASDRERSSSRLGRFRSISPAIRPALGGSGGIYHNNDNNNNNKDTSRSDSGSGSIREVGEEAAAAAATGFLWTGPVTTVQRTLSTASYTEFDLVHHLHNISGKHVETVAALGDVYRQRDELTVLTLFSLDPEVLDASDQFAACEVYEVRQDGSVIPRYDGCIDRHNEGLEASATWSLIKVSCLLGGEGEYDEKREEKEGGVDIKYGKLGREYSQGCGGKDNVSSRIQYADHDLTSRIHLG